MKDPTTGITHTIPGTDLVNQDFEPENQDFTPVKPDEKVPVKDKAHLTQEEKKQVEDKVKAKNPGKEVTVGEDGTATLKDPTTGITHTIPGTDLVNQDFGVNGIPEVTPIQPEYTDPVGTSSTDGEGNLIMPPTAEIPEFNGGTVAIDSPINKEDKYSEVQSPKVTKRLANTGETDTNVGLTGVGLAIAGSLLIFGKRRKKDEE